MATACVAFSGVVWILGGTCILQLCPVRAVPLTDFALIADVCSLWNKHHESVSVDKAIFQVLVRTDVSRSSSLELV